MAPSKSAGNRYSQVIEVDLKGKVFGERPLSSPAIRATVREATGKDGESKTGFEFSIEAIEPGGTAYVAVAHPKGVETWFSKEDEATSAAGEAAFTHGYAVYRKVLKEGFSDSVEKMRTLLGVLRDEFQIRHQLVKKQKRITYGRLSGEDLVLALGVAAKHFDNIDANASIHFRLRQSSDGHDWTKGKRGDGTARPYPGKIEKVGASAVELYRELLGFAPTFLVTLCASAWNADKSVSHRKARIHDLLSRARYDAEKRTFFLVEPVGAFAETMRLYADSGFAEQLEVAEAIVERLMDQEQMDLINLSVVADATGTENAKVAKGKKGARVLETGTAPHASESAPAAAVGH